MAINLNIRATLGGLNIGEIASFPIAKANTVRSTASQLALVKGFRFVTWQNNEDGTINVQRKRVINKNGRDEQ